MRERSNLICMVTINTVTSEKRESFCKKTSMYQQGMHVFGLSIF